MGSLVVDSKDDPWCFEFGLCVFVNPMACSAILGDSDDAANQETRSKALLRFFPSIL